MFWTFGFSVLPSWPWPRPPLTTGKVGSSRQNQSDCGPLGAGWCFFWTTSCELGWWLSLPLSIYETFGLNMFQPLVWCPLPIGDQDIDGVEIARRPIRAGKNPVTSLDMMGTLLTGAVLFNQVLSHYQSYCNSNAFLSSPYNLPVFSIMSFVLQFSLSFLWFFLLCIWYAPQVHTWHLYIYNHV